MMTAGNSVSLYIHVPFCTKKCPYCHFFVQPDSLENQELFLSALAKEWQLRSPLLKGKEITSIYFGGGTPSLLPAKSLEKILHWIQKGPASLSPSCEITLEANPETVSLQVMQEFSEVGINRVSIGVQSFDDNLLRILGRTHDSDKAKKAIHTTYEAGISNLSIDLMYELPHQTLTQWQHSLSQVADLPITHLSLYNLVFEPGTSFYKKSKVLSPSLPSEEDCLIMLQQAVKDLESYGLMRYEISAFAKPGYESLHNTGYWTARPFLGLGPSAFSYWEGRRFRNKAHLKKYSEMLHQNTLPEDFEEALPFEDKQKELLAVELRLLQGVDLHLFEQKNGILCPSLHASLEKLLSKQWLKQEGSLLRLTEEGLLFYDSVASEMI
ncbi:MAG: radical SAM family heme chaperone HemW [Rhabdochlamydiaceae bacterium]|nr:radical SAM family heme chaperone HemW [Rhabdochlamydiaceae bacterium]